MKLYYFQKGFNYSQDGPGNRLVYHLCGCNLSCPWCANPEGMLFNATFGKQAETEQIVQEILSSRPIFFDHGGVTFTGGEPTLQIDSLLSIMSKLQVFKINTCIETNGTSPRLPELFSLLSTLIMDFKHPDPELHQKWTGLDNRQIRQNIIAAAQTELPVQLRVPLIHSVNDDDAAVNEFIRFFSSINRNGITIEFLPYHEYGKVKWQQLGMEYTMKDAFVAKKQIHDIEEKCIAANLKIIHT